MTNSDWALAEAVSAIYFDDNSDYETALWQIITILGGGDAVELLEHNRAEAYLKYVTLPKELK